MVHPIPPVLLYACGSDANRIRSSRPMPLLSILVPVYNEARTVAEVLDRLAVIALPCDREVVVVQHAAPLAQGLVRGEDHRPATQVAAVDDVVIDE